MFSDCMSWKSVLIPYFALICFLPSPSRLTFQVLLVSCYVAGSWLLWFIWVKNETD